MTLLPICQVGWFRASAGVALWMVSSGALRNGPPLAVRMTRRTSCDRPQHIAWKMAECSESTGSSEMPRRVRFGNEQRSGDDESFLVGQGERFAGPDGGQGGGQTGRTDDGGHHDVHFIVPGQIDQPAFAREDARPAGAEQMPQFIDARFVNQRHRAGRKFFRLRRQFSACRFALRAERGMVPRCRMTSSVLHPIEPVDPRIAMRLLT